MYVQKLNEQNKAEEEFFWFLYYFFFCCLLLSLSSTAFFFSSLSLIKMNYAYITCPCQLNISMKLFNTCLPPTLLYHYFCWFVPFYFFFHSLFHFPIPDRPVFLPCLWNLLTNCVYYAHVFIFLFLCYCTMWSVVVLYTIHATDNIYAAYKCNYVCSVHFVYWITPEKKALLNTSSIVYGTDMVCCAHNTYYVLYSIFLCTAPYLLPLSLASTTNVTCHCDSIRKTYVVLLRFDFFFLLQMTCFCVWEVWRGKKLNKKQNAWKTCINRPNGVNTELFFFFNK